MKGVIEACKPRDDILKGKASDEIYAAHLGRVRDGNGPSVYNDPQVFFENTFATSGLTTVVKETFARLSGKDAGSSFIKLETSLGGGKTHSLIALYHIAKNGSKTPGADSLLQGMDFAPVRVAAIIGSEPGVVRTGDEPLTIWGIMAKQLFGPQGYNKIRPYDDQLTSPGEKALFDLFGKDRCLILIDEMALYLAKAATVKVGESTLAKQTIAFLQELSSVSSALTNVVVVITSLNRESVFRDETDQLLKILDTDVKKQKASEAVEEADRVMSRLVRNLTPTTGEEFSAVVRHRLFENIDEEAAEEVCRAYMQVLMSDSNADYLPASAREPKYLQNLRLAYPFHPELINTLRTKTSSIQNFNKTRGVLRLLSKVVRAEWRQMSPDLLIHPYVIDMRNQEFVEEIVSRLDKGEYQSALAADIANQRDQPRSSKVDDNFNEPLGTRIANIVFLNSMTGAVGSDILHGIKESEIHLSMARPGFDLKLSENALKLLEDNCFYLVRQGPTFAFHTEPNLNKIIENAKDSVEKTKVLGELENRIRALYGSRKYFEPLLFANEPAKVPDNVDKPKLVIIHYRDSDIKSKNTAIPENVRKIFEKKGTIDSTRVYLNNLLFLVADHDEIEKMELNGIQYLAMNQLVKDLDEGASYLAALSQTQRQKLKQMRQEAELYIKIAIVVCYKHIVLPSVQSDLEHTGSRKPLRIRTMRVSDSEAKSAIASQKGQDEAIVEFLIEIEAGRTVNSNELSPEFIIEQLWDKKKDSIPADEFKFMFYRNPSCGIIFSEDLIKKSLKSGLAKGKWIVVAQGELYDSKNYVQFYSGLTNDVEIILTDTETSRAMLDQFYCKKCGKRKASCSCEEKICNKCGKKLSECVCVEDLCSGCHRPIKDCICGQIIRTKEAVTMSRATKDLDDLLRDHNIVRISRIRIKPDGRRALMNLNMALPQFGKVEMIFDMEFSINQPTLGNNLKLEYHGNSNGYGQLKQLLSNYEAKSDFSSHDLAIEMKYSDGIDVKEILSILGEKVQPFTGEELYLIEMVPKQEDKV